MTPLLCGMPLQGNQGNGNSAIPGTYHRFPVKPSHYILLRQVAPVFSKRIGDLSPEYPAAFKAIPTPNIPRSHAPAPLQRNRLPFLPCFGRDGVVPQVGKREEIVITVVGADSVPLRCLGGARLPPPPTFAERHGGRSLPAILLRLLGYITASWPPPAARRPWAVP